jgi:hypothetical protein
MMYTGKPLAPGGPFARKDANQPQMTVWGNLMEARKTLLGQQKQDQGLVPSSWELCRKKGSGEIESLASP